MMLVRLLALLLALFASVGAAAAPVVVTPRSLAGYVYFPPGSGGGGSGTGLQETLQTCIVTPTAGDTTLVLSTRSWFGYTKPITVYYKMVGGGAGIARMPGSTALFPQAHSAGGSSAILKNGVLVNHARGMHGSEVTTGRTVVAGNFTVSSTDTLRFVLGGGASSGLVVSQYTGTWNYFMYTGGGGSGYYGGGAGQSQDSPGAVPTPGAAVAMGGTGTAGGNGAATGGLNYGASNLASPYNGGGGPVTGYGPSKSISYWNGYVNMPYTIGGGGGQGMGGLTTGDGNGGFSCPNIAPDRPSVMPKATSFNLDSQAGTAGYYFYYVDPATNGHFCNAGGGFGQIVLQYQAPTCDLIPQYDQP